MWQAKERELIDCQIYLCTEIVLPHHANQYNNQPSQGKTINSLSFLSH
jgi:hypothetical protein